MGRGVIVAHRVEMNRLTSSLLNVIEDEAVAQRSIGAHGRAVGKGLAARLGSTSALI